uniref:mannose-1-phosphate guanylyltransferase n=1 Tax=Candidatus Kentrum sp. TUN TaxID=2126343 RepID=A0A450ZR66_9GAMM|nr:MAG: mannose-1-phosphate guanylyltransferase / mannose-6-phosphate isomerase [Candidatus Kentron sp. TUN]VFK62502.1 MAG: mannose-1-phosphate guanylyltransferase / mannose-6-phosphate isomerase [Candidatus Kentron sp. TUN]
MIIPVILCGGSGTRLWPISRESFPKQFVPLIGDKSLLQITLERASVLGNDVICVAAEEHRFLVTNAMQAAEVTGPILLEPATRNTAAAMALAGLYAKQIDKSEALLLVCPSDHHIPDVQAFARTIRQGVAAAKAGFIVTFGVVPTSPSVAYGYILQGLARSDGSHQVQCFIEKPNDAKAKALILQGDALWNAGIFLTRATTLLHALAQHAPDILQSCEQAMARMHQEAANDNSRIFVRPEAAAFNACRSQSIDYAVMEKHAQTAVIPFNGQWSDVGSWNAVADLTPADHQGNRIDGQGIAHLANNTYIHAPHRPVVALGTQDLLIVDTPDAVLVAHRQRAEQVKDVLAQLKKDQYTQAVTHRRIARPWGWYDSVDVGERFQVKRISIKPGGSLSLQQHYHRSEHWVVVKGTAEVTRGAKTFLLSENQSTYIPIGEIHRLCNPGKLELEMIEIQSGSYLGEDDIQRFEDDYDR